MSKQESFDSIQSVVTEVEAFRPDYSVFQATAVSFSLRIHKELLAWRLRNSD